MTLPLVLVLISSTIAPLLDVNPVTPANPITDLALLQDAEVEPAEEASKWTGALNFGASVTGGNSDIKNASASADAVKELDKSRYTLGFGWNFSQENDVITQRRTGARFQYDRKLNERLYWLLEASAEADENASLDLRTTTGAGVGYQFYDREKFKLSSEAGLTYFTESFEVDEDTDYVSARLGYKATWDYSDQWAFSQATTVFPSLEESEDIFARADTRVKATLTKNMFAQLQWVYSWDNTPAAGKERVDNLYLLTIGWTF